MRPIPYLSLAAAVSLGLAPGFTPPLGANQIEGSAVAVDGDTLNLTGTRVRLAHIDAPETRQGCETEGTLWACGAAAGTALAALVEGQTLSCRALARDVYGREVAVCQSGVFDLGEEMVRRGLAIATDGAPEHYRAVESLAKRQRAGIWASDFRLPAEWRAANPLPEPTQTASRTPDGAAPKAAPNRAPDAYPNAAEPVYRSATGCAIKGNRNRKGEWIYHLPGRPYYDRTRAEEMFCTESEARAAGYRRSRA